MFGVRAISKSIKYFDVLDLTWPRKAAPPPHTHTHTHRHIWHMACMFLILNMFPPPCVLMNCVFIIGWYKMYNGNIYWCLLLTQEKSNNPSEDRLAGKLFDAFKRRLKRFKICVTTWVRKYVLIKHISPDCWNCFIDATNPEIYEGVVVLNS